MFFKRNIKTNARLMAPLSGQYLSLDAVPDKVFSGKVLGDGFAILPTEGCVVSPLNGRICLVADTLHAIGIQAENGLEVLIHVGVDTVKLNGQPFQPKVSAGDKVAQGQTLLLFDMNALKKAGCSLVSPVVITDMGKYQKLMRHETDNTIKGETCVVELV